MGEVDGVMAAKMLLVLFIASPISWILTAFVCILILMWYWKRH